MIPPPRGRVKRPLPWEVIPVLLQQKDMIAHHPMDYISKYRTG